MENAALDISQETRNGAQRRRTVSFSGSLKKRSREEVEDNVALQPESVSVEEQCSQQSNESFEVQARRKHSIYSFTSDLPESALKVRAFFQRIALAVWHHADSWWARVISWSILSFLLYIMLYVITSDEMSYDGHLFRLIVMLVGAHLVGLLVQRFLRVPALLGMLITGCVLRNVGFYHPTKGAFGKQTRVLKQLATTVGMVKAGMRLVPDAIYSALHCHHGLRLAGLGMIPSFMEAMVTLLVSYFVLGYPPIWAVCLGFLLCPVSPSVITPPMVELMEAGYGEEKNIGVLIHGAAGLDVAFSVSVFDICLALLFRRREIDPAQMVAMGSIDVLIDLGGGFILGLIAGFLPVEDNSLAVWKRTVAVMAGGMIAIVSGPELELPGTGPLSCICTAFIASMLWKLQTPLTSPRTVNDIMQGLWVVLCPMLFAFTGSDINLVSSGIDVVTWCWMIFIVLLTVIVRLLACFLVLCCGDFSWKEMLFFGLIFQGKATNQAALAPQILYAAYKVGEEEEIMRATKAVAMGAMSILICTPLAHLGAKLGGPYLLTRKARPRPPPTDTTSPPPV